MQPISSLSAVSMSPSKSFATQRNGGVYVGGKQMKGKQKRKVVKRLVQERMPIVTDKKLLRTFRSLLLEGGYREIAKIL